MLNFYKTMENKLVQLPKEEEGCWVRVTRPTQEEIEYLVGSLQLDSGFVSASLDEEEASRMEKEDDQTFVVVDVPYRVEDEETTITYITIPLGIIITPKYFVTISSSETAVIDEIVDGTVRNVETKFRTRFLLIILLRIAQRFLLYLKQIERLSSRMESQFTNSTKNEALIQLLGLEKSLVYFSTSLRANETTLKKLSRGRTLTLYEEDEDLLQDTLIEFNQAIEMSGIYSNILSGTMDAVASIINNNLNTVMKVLTSVTILMTIPTMVFSYYGMNVAGLQIPVWWFPTLVSLILALVALVILMKFKMFK